ncbi:hypothetical protein C3L33_00678, partial [Rhododendron williamsianum]
MFAAIAELLDNAVDEIQNEATFVNVDKTSNPRDGNPALLIQDDGGGMDPEAMRHCLSFGFSDKKSKSAIGQYGNGFKTSTMRLGADVIVFSRHYKERKLTQSIGLLSYTFLMQTGHDRIVVPMVDYEFNASTGTFEALDLYDEEHFMFNLSMLLKWSPYSTEAELLKQFDDIGYHGTKIIVYNLWLTDGGTLELDFDSDPEDICVSGDAITKAKGINRTVKEQHIANRLRHSLRVYLSILYLRVPESFSIILRGQVVVYHNIAMDLKFPEFILYKPHSGGCVEGQVVTTIGFLKEAPHVDVHGFNVYYKNRLILPFWHVVNYSDSRGRGVVGVLEANFIEPTHNKQDFEKTSVFQKLEYRLKEMTWEYWDHHCGLIGYQVKKKPRAPTTSALSADQRPHNSMHQPIVLNRDPSAVPLWHGTGSSRQSFPKIQRNAQQGELLKRREQSHLQESEMIKRRKGEGVNVTHFGPNHGIQSAPSNLLKDQEAKNLLQENKRLRAQCLEFEKEEEVLNSKVTLLKNELRDAEREYARLLVELRLLNRVKKDK